MTEGTSPQPIEPQQKPSVNEQEPEKSASRRSNEFWLAMAGIFATVLVGMTASTLAYRTSGNQIKAETDRAAVQFTKEQRKSAYVDFLTTYTDLSEAEFEFTHQLTLIDDFDMKGAQDKSDLYYAQTSKCRNASAAVELVGSQDVNNARGELVDQHNDIQNLIQPLAVAIARAGNPRSYAGKVSELQRIVDNVQRDDDRMRKNFINAAKRDLGLVG